MTDALNYLFDIYYKFVDFVFNDMEFFENVTLGWVCISVLVFGILIHSLLSIPRGIYYQSGRKDTYE